MFGRGQPGFRDQTGGVERLLRLSNVPECLRQWPWGVSEMRHGVGAVAAASGKSGRVRLSDASEGHP